MKTKILIHKGDITKLEVDAIVNAANKSLLGGGGVDGAIHRAAGKELLEECRTLNGCQTGEAKITKGYKLHAKYVIHTVGPIWRGIDFKPEEQDKQLALCYRNSLKLAVDNEVKSIAFPNISTGVYHYPLERAAKIATSEVINFAQENNSLDTIIFAIFSDENLQIYKKLLG